MNTRELLFASGNHGKCKEILKSLEPLNIKVHLQSDMNITSIEETGLTFVENAILKARHAAEQTNFPSLADDSGLVVEALNGAPGIKSARFAGDNATSTDNISHLLRLMNGSSNRKAYFYCILVLLQHSNDPEPKIFEGRWFGEILKKSTGHSGFGYDPVFYVPEHNCSAAELNIQEKNNISHRGQAITQLKKYYEQIST